MKYFIDKTKNESAYLQLYLQLRRDITEGVYKYGERLPSKRLLAEETGVSVITVEHAYGILCDEGYTVSRQKSGYFAAFRSEEFLSSAEIPHAKPSHIISVASDSDFPFSLFAKTMRSVISEYGERLLIKPPNKGLSELREAIAQYLGRAKGMSISPSQIIIGSGAEYLYGLIVQLMGRDKIYAVEDPSYEKILSVYRANGAQCELLKLGNDGIMSQELARSQADILHITPYRSFPSGVTASASKRREYIGWALSRKSVVIEDDFESEFTVSTKHEDTIFSLEPQGSVIYINTFTQTIAPSMRVGYMVLPPPLLKKFDDTVGFYSCTVPAFEQYVLAHFISGGDFERHVNRVRKKRRLMVNS